MLMHYCTLIGRVLAPTKKLQDWVLNKDCNERVYARACVVKVCMLDTIYVYLKVSPHLCLHKNDLYNIIPTELLNRQHIANYKQCNFIINL